MGLISAGVKSVTGTLKDQWKDYFYCDALRDDVLVAKARNKGKGNDNIITDGSVVAVANGQCMLIVEQGRIVDVCAEAGEFIYDSQSEPSFFGGSFKEGLKNVLETMKERFTFGGSAGKDQRVYYINTKELPGNKFGTANPIPFRVVDKNIHLDIDVSIRCHGVYSFKIVNPVLFYINVCGNVADVYTKDQLEGQMKTEIMSALQPAFAKISTLQIRPNEIPSRVEELCQFLNEVLSAKWQGLRGMALVSVAINSVTLPDEDEEIIKQAQRSAMMKDPGMAAATLLEAQADALKTAASNSGGAMTGFMGMNMVNQTGGVNAQALYDMAAKQAPGSSSDTATWTCACNTVNTGKFCTSCGKPKPQSSWQCECGAINQGNFCSECGKPKPKAYRCDKCGWQVEDMTNLPKFCPQCGDPFDDNDKQ